MVDVLVQCGHLLMVPHQLSRLNFDTDSTDLLPPCVTLFWKPILQTIVADIHLVTLIVEKIFSFLTDFSQLPSANPSIIDRQRIGWIFYFVDQPSLQLDLSSIFVRLARILQPWFAEQLSQMVVRMSDESSGGGKALISEQKRDTLLRTISMFAHPFVESAANETTISPLTIFPRNQLNQREMTLFRKRTRERPIDFDDLFLFCLGPMVSDVPIGLVNNEDEQDLEMNVDLSRTDRNCSFVRPIFEISV